MAHKRKPARAERAEQPTSPEALVGQVLGENYRLVRILGSGGHATVFEAKRVKPALKVAVKVLNPNAADPSIPERFRQEVRIARLLKGLHQVAYLDDGEIAGGQPFWVMEYLDGEDLASRLDRLTRLEGPEVITLAEAMGEALGEAHELGIVHRDIKPANVFFARGPNGAEAVKVLDFGAARVQHSDSNLTQTGQIIGTPWYMSPEQARGQPLDPRSDQFSLAILLFQVLTGEVPFNAPQPTEVLFKLTGDPHPSPVSLEPTLPGEIEPVFDRALSKTADARYPTVREFVASLRIALSVKPKRRATVVVKRDQLEPSRPLPATPDEELARILATQGVLEAEPIARAQRLAAESRLELADAIVQLGILEEEALLQAVTGRGSRYHLSNKVRSASPKGEAVARVSSEVALRLRIAPLGWSEVISELRVYSATPPIRDLEDQLRAARGADRVSVILALPSAVTSLIRRTYGLAEPGQAAEGGALQVEASNTHPPEASDTSVSEEIAGPPAAVADLATPAVLPAADRIEESSLPKLAVTPAAVEAEALAEEPPAERRFPAVEYVPGAGHHPATARLRDDLARRAVARAVEALGARHAVLALADGITHSHTIGALPPGSVLDPLQIEALASGTMSEGWSTRRAPIILGGRAVGTLFALFDAELRPERLDDPASIGSVAELVACALNRAEVPHRRSRDLDEWLDGRRLLLDVGAGRGASLGGADLLLAAPVLALDLRPLLPAAGDPAKRFTRLGQALRRATALVFAFGGRVAIYGDGLLAVWGSSDSGSSDTRRALECALALRSLLESPTPLHLGVSHGEVLLGSVEVGSSSTPLLAGTAIAAAWRLGGYLPGGVVTDRATLIRSGGALSAQAYPLSGHDDAFEFRNS